MLRASITFTVVLSFMILMFPAHGSQPLHAQQPHGPRVHPILPQIPRGRDVAAREAVHDARREVALARTMFGDAIDYDRARIVRAKWWPFQPVGIAMAPTGNIHFHPRSENYRDDFSQAPLPLQGLFIHEMTHVWQAQRHGRFYLPLMRHPFCRYTYALREDWPLARYGLEQQAEIMRHIFLSRRGVVLPGKENLAALERQLPFRKA